MRRRFQQAAAWVLVTATALLAPVAAAAADPGGKSNLFAGDVGNMIWTLVVFLLVVFVLGKFAWGPLLGALQSREDFIRDSLAKAKADREAAEARLAEYEKKLADARAEATAIVDEGRRDAEVVKAKIEGDAKDETERMLERAKREIDLAHRAAVQDLYQRSATLATDIASKVLGREVSAADHERLIQESIERLESESPKGGSAN